MEYRECPPVLREFLSYHENIKGQSAKTIEEYYLDLRHFLKFMLVLRKLQSDDPTVANLSNKELNEVINNTKIRNIDLDFIKSIRLQDIYDYFSFLSEDRIFHPQTNNPGQGIDNAARARKLSAIKSFYKYLTVRTHQLDENPVADVEYPKLRRSLPKYLTLEQSLNLLASVRGTHADRDLAMLLIFLNCGVRISELAGLNLGDIYQDRLRVLGKGNKERTVYLTDSCIRALNIYNNSFEEALQHDPKRPLFVSQKGGRMSTNAIHRMVKKHLNAAGLDATQYSAHKLRHTAATLMLAQGIDVKTVQEVLGHEHLNTTEIYTHIESSSLKMAADANPLSDYLPSDS